MKNMANGKIIQEIQWKERRETLKLEGTPVLEYLVKVPHLNGKGRGQARMDRCFDRMAQSWEERWKKKIYCLACLQCIRKGVDSRPFIAWKCSLSGQETYVDNELVSFCMEAEECWGDQRPCRLCWGEIWQYREGVPRGGKVFLWKERGWKRKAIEAIAAQGRARKEAWDWFPNRDWEKKAAELLPELSPWLTEDSICFGYPQGSLACAADGTPIFTIPRNIS